MGEVVITVQCALDETGRLEEMTWDLFPLLDSADTTHLDTHGLPVPGTVLRPGMILVGKIGRSGAYAAGSEPCCMEVHGTSRSELRIRYGHMWRNGSVYVNDDTAGVVVKAECEERSGIPTAHVVIETGIRADG